MDYDIPYTNNKLMEKLGLKSKDGFRRNYLFIQQMELNLVQMTIPDKPRSRNQALCKGLKGCYFVSLIVIKKK